MFVWILVHNDIYNFTLQNGCNKCFRTTILYELNYCILRVSSLLKKISLGLFLVS